MSRAPLRVAISAEIAPGQEGGIEQTLIGLLRGLGQLVDGDEEYLVVGPWTHPDWLAPHVGPNQRLVSRPAPVRGRREAPKRWLGPARRPAGVAWRRTRRLAGHPVPSAPLAVPASDGFYESLGADVLHVTYPLHFFTSPVPIVFSMYDLQHRHWPEFFPPGHLAWREHVYPAAFRQARATVVDSRWVKADVLHQYGVPYNDVYVAHLASATDAYEPVTEAEVSAIQRRLRLPETFILYPALTYQHKNHVALLEAIAYLRDQTGHIVHVVCTGKQKLYWPAIRRRWHELALENQVRFLGFVPAGDLRALYRLAQFLVFPTLFEGAGLPLLEAFREGTPVACSDIPVLREYGGDAAAYFDPRSVQDIAGMIRQLSVDDALRARLCAAASKRAERFTWERTARIYRAVYRQVAGRPLAVEDQAVLDEAAQGSTDRGPATTSTEFGEAHAS